MQVSEIADNGIGIALGFAAANFLSYAIAVELLLRDYGDSGCG